MVAEIVTSKPIMHFLRFASFTVRFASFTVRFASFTANTPET